MVTFSDADQCFMQFFIIIYTGILRFRDAQFYSVLTRTRWHRLNAHLPIHFRKADIHIGMNCELFVNIQGQEMVFNSSLFENCNLPAQFGKTHN